jgi:hypothetical protein
MLGLILLIMALPFVASLSFAVNVMVMNEDILHSSWQKVFCDWMDGQSNIL